MKKLSLIGLAILFASSGAFAAGTDVPSTFNVTVTFTGSCSVKTAATDIAFSYAAFDTSPRGGTTSTVFQCSRGLAPTFRFDDNGTTATSSAAAATGITGEGVISGIRYTLTGATVKAAGTAASAGAAGTGGSDGTADQYTVTINANAAAGQAGSGLGGAAVSQLRTLYITY